MLNGEDDDADHPGRRAAVAPARHEVLAPQVQHHEDEEDLDRPEVQAVHEPPDARLMPPLRPEEGQHDAAGDDPDEAGDRDDAEDVDPRADVDGWRSGNRCVSGSRRSSEAPDRKRPARGLGLGRGVGVTHRCVSSGSAASPWPGNGASRATTKTAIIPRMTSTFGMEIRMKFQLRYVAGASKGAPLCSRRNAAARTGSAASGRRGPGWPHRDDGQTLWRLAAAD